MGLYVPPFPNVIGDNPNPRAVLPYLLNSQPSNPVRTMLGVIEVLDETVNLYLRSLLVPLDSPGL